MRWFLPLLPDFCCTLALFPLRIACTSSGFFFNYYFYLCKITVYTPDLYFKCDCWRWPACWNVKAVAKAMIDQFPRLQTLDTAAVACQSKSADDIIRSATFPAAHAPSSDDSSQSEGITWPYALSVLGTVSSRWACLFCCLRAMHRALCNYLAALISLRQRLNCILASLWTPAVFRVSPVFFFKICMHRAEMFPSFWFLPCYLELEKIFFKMPHNICTSFTH